MRLTHHLMVDRAAGEVYQLVADAGRLQASLPGTSATAAAAPASRAIRLGSLQAGVATTVTVLTADPATREVRYRIHAAAMYDGDRDAGTIDAHVRVRCDETGSGTAVRLTIDADITGELARHGHALLRDRLELELSELGLALVAAPLAPATAGAAGPPPHAAASTNPQQPERQQPAPRTRSPRRAAGQTALAAGISTIIIWYLFRHRRR